MAVKASTLGPGSLKIGVTATAREFAAQLTKAALTPETDAEDDVDTLSGEKLPGVDVDTWTISGTVLQDYELDSLEDFCFENKGTTMPFQFTPSNAGARSYSGTLKVRPITVGGDVKKRNTSDFEFPVVGDPIPGAVV